MCLIQDSPSLRGQIQVLPHFLMEECVLRLGPQSQGESRRGLPRESCPSQPGSSPEEASAGLAQPGNGRRVGVRAQSQFTLWPENKINSINNVGVWRVGVFFLENAPAPGTHACALTL